MNPITKLRREGIRLMEEGRYDEALPFHEQCLKLCQEKLGAEHRYTLSSRNQLAKLLVYQGDYQRAKSLHEELLEQVERISGPSSRATTTALDSLGEVLGFLGDYEAALRLHERALKNMEAHLGPRHIETAVTKTYLARVCGKLGDVPRARELYRAALEVEERVWGPSHPATVDTLGNLGRLLRESGDFAAARETLDRSLRLRQKAIDAGNPDTIALLSFAGNLYRDLGDDAQAFILFERAREIAETALGPKHPNVTGALLNVAMVLRDIGDTETAKSLLKKAVQIREDTAGKNNPDIVPFLTQLASLHQEAKQFTEARRLFERTVAICERASGPDHPNTATAYNNLATCLEAEGNYGLAKEFHLKALKIYERSRGNNHPSVATSLANLAVVASRTGEWSEARSFAERALTICETVFGTNHPNLMLALEPLVPTCVHLGDQSSALRFATRATTAQEQLLANVFSFTSERQRLLFRAGFHPFESVAMIGDPRLLARSILRFKGIVLDSLMEDRRMSQKASSPELQSLRLARQQLLNLELSYPDKPAAVAAWRERCVRLRQETERIEAAFARNATRIDSVRQALVATPEQVQAVLPEHHVLVDYLSYQREVGTTATEPCYGALVLAKTGTPKWIPLGSAAAINSLVATNFSMLRKDTLSAPFEENLRSLYDSTWAKIALALPPDTKTVIVSPDGWLNYVSFATLLTPSRKFLCEDFSLRYVASGRDLLVPFQSTTNRTLEILASPRYDLPLSPPGQTPSSAIAKVEARNRISGIAPFPSLPNTLLEAKAVSSRASTWNLSQEALMTADTATEANLQSVQSPFLLLLATHGFFWPEPTNGNSSDGALQNPMRRSGLALAGANTTISNWISGRPMPASNDGILMAEEAAELNLAGTYLTVLSACDTGIGDVLNGEGVMGLRRAFAQAGTRHLALALFPVLDGYAPRFQERFLEATMQTGNAPEALAKVQKDELLQLRSKYRDVYAAVRRAGPFVLTSQGVPDSEKSRVSP